jgi:tetratricopeptide (TPR) repeat protein
MQHGGSSMHQLFRLANSNYTGKPAVTVPEFLQLGVKTLPDYIRNPADLLQAKIALAESMYDNGDLNDAKTIFMETAATARSLNDIEAQAESYAYAGQIAFSQGDESAGKHLTADALRLAQRRGVSPGIRVRAMDYYAWNRENHGFLSDEDLHLLRSAADEARRYNLPLHEKADAIHLLASNLEFRGQLDQAKPLFDEALALLNQDPASVCDKAEISGELAFLSQSKLDYQGALGLYQRAYDGYSACSGADGRESLSMLSYLTSTLTELGRAPEAVQLMERSKPAWEKLPDPFGRWGVFPTALARAYIATGRYTDAEGLIGQLAEAHKKLSAPILMAYFDYLWAEALAGEHRYDEALPHAEYAVKVADSLPPSFFVSPEGHQRIAKSKRLLSDIRARTGTSPHEAPALGTAHLGRSEPTK